MKEKILVVDDDVNIAELLSLYLSKEGFEFSKVYSGKKALEAFPVFAPNLVLLDLMLPDGDGYSICREIRKISKVPIIMLTAKGDTFDKVLGLEMGADDYIVKPFEPKEVIARIKAVLRRYDSQKETDSEKLVVVPNMTVNQSAFEVIYYGKKLDFPPKEFELLYLLVTHPNIVFTRDQLLDKIWGYEFYGDTRTVDVHVKRIREKLNKEDNWSIKTIWGVGYKFEV